MLFNLGLSNLALALIIVASPAMGNPVPDGVVSENTTKIADATLTPGLYFIVNSIRSHKGKSLAVTFNGNMHPVSVTPKLDRDSGSADDDQAVQQWMVVDFGSKTHVLRPSSVGGLDVSPGPGYVTASPPKKSTDYVWTIKNVGNGHYTIQDGDGKVFWEVEKPYANTWVTMGSTGDNRAKWVFEQVQ